MRFSKRMKRAQIALLVLSLASPFAVCAQQSSPATAQPSVAPRVVANSQRVETVPFHSTLVGAELPYYVVLPTDYAQPAQRATRYPVLYLLHGFGGGPEQWLGLNLLEYTAARSMIVVLVEGRNSWYTDSASAPDDKFESYIVRELIPDVDRRYRTRAARDGRGVAGLSMGGYGALKFGVKYPEMFAFAASMSGAVGVSSWRTEDELPNSPSLRRSLIATFGAADNPVHIANDLYRLAREVPAERIANLPFLYLDCGTEDFLFETNRVIADILVQRRIPHEYRQLPGSHSAPYWRTQLREVIEMAARRMSLSAQRATTRTISREHLWHRAAVR